MTALLGTITAVFTGSRLGLYLVIGSLFALIVLGVVLKLIAVGRDAERTEALNAALQRMRKRLEIKNRQLDAANDRPDRDDLGRVLDEGEF